MHGERRRERAKVFVNMGDTHNPSGPICFRTPSQVAYATHLHQSAQGKYVVESRRLSAGLLSLK